MSEPWIGIIIQTALLLLAGGAMLVRNDVSLKSFQKEIGKMQHELQSLAQVVTKQAVQDQRLNEQSRRMTMLEQRVHELQRGAGWIQDHGAQSVDREY